MFAIGTVSLNFKSGSSLTTHPSTSAEQPLEVFPVCPSVSSAGDYKPFPKESENDSTNSNLVLLKSTADLYPVSKPMDTLQFPFYITSTRHDRPLFLHLLFPSRIPFLLTTLIADFEKLYSNPLIYSLTPSLPRGLHSELRQSIVSTHL